MGYMLTIARREFTSYFLSPIAYVVIGLFMLLAGLLFLMNVFLPGEPATLRGMFVYLIWVLIPVAPAISMRLVAEELRSGSIETLMTSPITDTQVILGKWLGGLGFFLSMLGPTLLFVLTLAIWGEPDYGPILTGYIGIFFVGALYMSIGTFASVMSRNQIISFLVTVFIILMLTVVPYFLPRVVPAWAFEAVSYVNVNDRFNDFAKGVFDFSHLIYFATVTAFFLLLAVKLLESRKWR
jgi:ABC-2 type transport system permease protein